MGEDLLNLWLEKEEEEPEDALDAWLKGPSPEIARGAAEMPAIRPPAVEPLGAVGPAPVYVPTAQRKPGLGRKLLTGAGVLGEALDKVFTRPVKRVSAYLGGRVLLPSDIGPILQRRPAAPAPTTERLAKMPQWEISAEVRGGLGAKPDWVDYLIGIPAEIMTDWSLLTGAGFATAATKLKRAATAVQKASKVVQGAQKAGKSATVIKTLVKNADEALDALNAARKTSKEILVRTKIPFVGKERFTKIPGTETLGRLVGAIKKPKPAFRMEKLPLTEEGMRAFETGEEIAGEVGYRALKAQEETAERLAKLRLSPASKMRAQMAAELVPRRMAGDPEAIRLFKQFSPTERRAAFDIHKGHVGITTAREAAGVPTPKLTELTEKKLVRTEKRLGRIEAGTRKRVAKEAKQLGVKAKAAQAEWDEKTIKRMLKISDKPVAKQTTADLQLIEDVEAGLMGPEAARLTRAAEVAAAPEAQVRRLGEVLGKRKGYQKGLARKAKLERAIEEAPAYVTRVTTPAGRRALVEAEGPALAQARIHGLTRATRTRTMIDPATGRSKYLYEIEADLQRVLVDDKFAQQHPSLKILADTAEKERGKLTERLRTTVRGEKSPLVSYIYAAPAEETLKAATTQAIRDAEVTGFVKALGEGASETVKPGWVHAKTLKSGNKPFDSLIARMGDVFISPEVAKELKRTGSRLGDKSTAGFMFDQAQSYWKWSVTVPFPGFHARNASSNLVMIVSEGVDPKSPIITDGIKAYYSRGSIQIGKKAWNAKDIKRLADANRASGGFAAKEIGRRISVTDELFRYGYYADRLRAGMSPAEAGRAVRKALLDYGNMSQVERRWVKRVVPFYSWLKNTIPRQMEYFFTKPYVANAQLKGLKVAGAWEERGEARVFGLGFPIQDVAEVAELGQKVLKGEFRRAAKDVAFNLSPVVKGIGGITLAERTVRAPKGAEKLPAWWRSRFGIHQVDKQWVMPRGKRALADAFRLFNEVRRHYTADTPGEAWVRTLTGLTFTSRTSAEQGLSAVYDRERELKDAWRERGWIKLGPRGMQVPGRAARQSAEWGEWAQLQRAKKILRQRVEQEQR